MGEGKNAHPFSRKGGIHTMKKNGFLKSAAVLSLGGILAKGIGALYRIPLTGLLGGYGMGLYQMAYPLFCLLLTLSSAGIPSALARLVARERARGGSGRETLQAALRLFAILGLLGSVLMCLFAPHMSRLQGERELIGCYFALAPSVFLVALIAVFRGWFQGKNDMRPTALSEIAEQLVKALFGLFFATRYAKTPARAAEFCLLSVTISELVALLFLAMRFRGEGVKRTLPFRRTSGAQLLLSVLPVMAATALLPLSQTVDSVVLVRLLRGQSERAVALYGLFSGGALSLVSLPATLCYGLAAASVPSLSRTVALGDGNGARDRALSVLSLTLLLSLPCALGLFFFSKTIVSLLYPTLAAAEADTLVRLIRLISVSALSLAGVDTLAACLVGMGRANRAAFSMLLAVCGKFVLEFIFVPRLSVSGAALAVNFCYLLAFFLDLFYTVKKPKERANDLYREPRRREGGSDPQGEGDPSEGGRGACAHSRNSVGADAG